MQIALKENWNVLLPKNGLPFIRMVPKPRAEQRRTGYPKILPNIINNSQGTVSTKDFIRRIPIPLKYRENNGPGYQRAAATLGRTRYWQHQNCEWDKIAKGTLMKSPF